MRRWWHRATGLLAAALLAGCAALPQAFDPDEAAALKAQADAWDAAIVRQDRAAIEANMAEDFRQIGSRGEVEDRRSFVEQLMDPALRIDPYTVEEFEIRRYGEVALLSGRTRMSGRYGDAPFRTHYRYIDVYVRRGGAWKIVSVQTSRIPDPP